MKTTIHYFRRSMGGAMSNGRSEFTILEQAMVIGIILFLLAVVVGNVLHAVKESQERSVHAAAVEYAALRTVYVRTYPAPARGAARYNTPGQ